MAWSMYEKYEAPHRCDTPRTYHPQKADIHLHDIIQCECGKLWRCTNERHESDQREGISWVNLDYTEVPAKPTTQYMGLYAPGTK